MKISRFNPWLPYVEIIMRLETPQPLTGDDNMPAVGEPDDWEWIGEDGLTDSQRALQTLTEAGMLPVFTEEELPEGIS